MRLADTWAHVSLGGEADEVNASGVGGRVAGAVARGRGGVPEGGPYGAEAGRGGVRGWPSVPDRGAYAVAIKSRQQSGLIDDRERQQALGHVPVLRVLDGEGDAVEIGHGDSFQGLRTRNT